MTFPLSPETIDRFRRDLDALTSGAEGSLGIAVSGGPDSLALLLLAHATLPGRVQAATVDHGLRPEAADEAEFVAETCARLGVPHEILHPLEPIAGSLQSAARAARYGLLERWRERHALDWIATAHHADDQAETLLMRLNRGSGAAGLAGVRAVNGRIIRPLLAWRRAELEAIVTAAGLDPVRDPSNSDERYDRARLRARLADADWIDPAAFARSAAAFAEAEQALAWTADRLWQERASQGQGSLTLDPADLPPELRRRLTARALAHANPAAAPRGEELTRLLRTLEQGATATLAGVKCTGGSTWTFAPAPPRRA